MEVLLVCPIRRDIFEDQKVMNMSKAWFLHFLLKAVFEMILAFVRRILKFTWLLFQGLMIGFNDCFKIEVRNPMRRLGLISWISREKSSQNFSQILFPRFPFFLIAYFSETLIKNYSFVICKRFLGLFRVILKRRYHHQRRFL